MTNSPKIIAVIGAGITGTTTAYNLVRRGHDVTLFDKHPYPAMETSFANGGQLSASNAEVWNNWSTIFKGIKWMFNPGAPLWVHPEPSWHKISWMLEFMAAIPKYENNTVTTVRLAIEAREHLRKIAEDEDIRFDREDRGILHFYRTKADFETGARVTEILKKGGLERRAVTPEEVRDMEPALKGEIYGGFFTDSDYTGDIHKFTNELGKACERRGATMQMRTEILDIASTKDGLAVTSRTAQSEQSEQVPEPFCRIYDQVVICAGVMSRRLAKILGDRVNVYPVKGYSITVNLLEKEDQDSAPWMSLLDDQAKLVTSRLGADRFRVAGTAEYGGFNRDISWKRIEPMIEWCRMHFPGMSTRQCVPWAGLRPMMPNMMPFVGQGRNPRVFYNTGHGHLGWTLSAATADAVGDLMTAGSNRD